MIKPRKKADKKKETSSFTCFITLSIFLFDASYPEDPHHKYSIVSCRRNFKHKDELGTYVTDQNQQETQSRYWDTFESTPHKKSSDACH
jgi:hypothetical protein